MFISCSLHMLWSSAISAASPQNWIPKLCSWLQGRHLPGLFGSSLVYLEIALLFFLVICIFWRWWNDICGHHEDAGVLCSGDRTTQSYESTPSNHTTGMCNCYRNILCHMLMVLLPGYNIKNIFEPSHRSFLSEKVSICFMWWRVNEEPAHRPLLNGC